MNNELFDKILKSELDKVTVTPSAGLSKAVGTKLFMQNVVVFHKIKAIAAFFVIGSVTAAGLMYSGDSNDISVLSHTNDIISTEAADFNDQLISIAPIDDKVSYPAASIEPAKWLNTEEDKAFDTKKDDKLKYPISKTGVDAGEAIGSGKTPDVISINENNSLSDKDQIEPNSVIPNIPTANKSKYIEIVENDPSLLIDLNQEIEGHKIERIEVATKDIVPNILAIEKLSAVDLPEVGKMPRVIVKEVSFDLYGLGKGISDIDNSISSAVYKQYHWDFYKESEGLAMQNGIGGQVNFAVGTPRLKFKTAIGLNTSKFIDTKAKYSSGEIKNQDWLDYFGTDELSWVNTYGEDSCEVCMYASNTDNFQSEMKEDFNRYSYINIPIKAGMEFDLKRFSVSAFGGVQLSQLISAKGLGVSNREFSENERFYYWNDIKVVSLQDDNQIMKSRFLSYHAGVDVRVRILPKFDLLAGFEMNASAGEITEAGNVVRKSVSYQQGKVGLTFHPSRLAVKPKF